MGPTPHETLISPNSPITGIFSLARTVKRPLPNSPHGPTREYIHASVLQQEKLNPALAELLAQNPTLIAPLLPLEVQVHQNWPSASGALPSRLAVKAGLPG